MARGFDNDIAFCNRSPKRVLALGRNLPCEQEVWCGEESTGFGLDLNWSLALSLPIVTTVRQVHLL